jgi:Tfp pilus assembly protein PilF
LQVVDLSVSLTLDDSANNVGALLQRGILHSRHGQPNAATRDFRRALAILKAARSVAKKAKEEARSGGKKMNEETRSAGNKPHVMDDTDSGGGIVASQRLGDADDSSRFTRLEIFATCQLGLIAMLERRDLHGALALFTSAVETDPTYANALLYRQGERNACVCV